MKTVEVEKTFKETWYEAVDGKQFKSQEECIKYENTTKCVIESKYKKLHYTQETEYNLFGLGAEDCYIDIIRISQDSDKDIILQKCAYYTNNKQLLEKYSKILDTAVIGDYVLCFSGSEYDDCFYIMCNYADYIMNLNSKILFNESN